MSEHAFTPDFLFSTLKNVHFGSDTWVIVTTDIGGAADQNLPTVNTTLNFPGLAGGTPGIEIRHGLIQFQHKITKADLSTHARTGAGLALDGAFGVNNINSFNNQFANQLAFSSDILDSRGYSNAAQFFFLPPTSNSFDLNLTWTAIPGSDTSPTASFLASVFFGTREQLLGTAVPLPLPAEFPSPIQASYTPLGTSTGGSVQFSVNPTKKTVKLLTSDH